MTDPMKASGVRKDDYSARAHSFIIRELQASITWADRLIEEGQSRTERKCAIKFRIKRDIR